MTTLQELWLYAGGIMLCCAVALILMATNGPHRR